MTLYPPLPRGPFYAYIYKILEWPSESRIRNSIKPYRVQYIIRHFYYTTIQKLCKFEALSGQKINVNVIKAAHRRSYFLKTLVSQKHLQVYFKEKIWFKIPRILDLKNCVNVSMRTDAWFNNIFMYLYNRNILEYAQILVTSDFPYWQSLYKILNGTTVLILLHN